MHAIFVIAGVTGADGRAIINRAHAGVEYGDAILVGDGSDDGQALGRDSVEGEHDGLRAFFRQARGSGAQVG